MAHAHVDIPVGNFGAGDRPHAPPAYAPQIADFLSALRVVVEGSVAKMARERHRLLGHLLDLSGDPTLVLAMMLLFQRLPLSPPLLLALKNGLWHIGRALLDPAEVPDTAVFGPNWAHIWSWLVQNATAKHEELGAVSAIKWTCANTDQPITDPATTSTNGRSIDPHDKTVKLYDRIECQRQNDLESEVPIELPGGALTKRGDGFMLDDEGVSEWMSPSPVHRRLLRISRAGARRDTYLLPKKALAICSASAPAQGGRGADSLTVLKPIPLSSMAVVPGMRLYQPLQMKSRLGSQEALLVRCPGKRLLVHLGSSGAADGGAGKGVGKGGGDASEVVLFDPHLPQGGPKRSNLDKMQAIMIAERRKWKEDLGVDDQSRVPDEAVMVIMDISQSMAARYSLNHEADQEERKADTQKESDTLFVALGKFGDFERYALKYLDTEGNTPNSIKDKVGEDVDNLMSRKLGYTLRLHNHRETGHFSKGSFHITFRSAKEAAEGKAAFEDPEATVFGLKPTKVDYAGNNGLAGKSGGKRGSGGKGGKEGKGGKKRWTADDQLTRLSAAQESFKAMSDMTMALDLHNVVGLLFFGSEIHCICELTE